MAKTRSMNIDKVTSALKRAASAAVHGSQEERAGRFIGRDSATGQFIENVPNGKSASDSMTKQIKRK